MKQFILSFYIRKRILSQFYDHWVTAWLAKQPNYPVLRIQPTWFNTLIYTRNIVWQLSETHNLLFKNQDLSKTVFFFWTMSLCPISFFGEEKQTLLS